MKDYKTEARERWGDTLAYREHEKKTKNYTKEKQKMINNLKSIWDQTDEDLIVERLDSIIRGDTYV